MITAADILFLAEQYAKSESISLSTVSSRVFGDGKKLDTIRDKNADLTLKRATAAIAWFVAKWPADLPWPADVPRPAASDSEDAA